MGDLHPGKPPKADQLNIFDRCWRAICWLQIAISPALLGAIVGFFAAMVIGGGSGLVVGIAIAVAGLAAGIAWAERVRRTSGTEAFMRRLVATDDANRGERNQKVDGRD